MKDILKPALSASNYESAFAADKLATQPGVFVGRYGDPTPAPAQNLTIDMHTKPDLAPQ